MHDGTSVSLIPFRVCSVGQIVGKKARHRTTEDCNFVVIFIMVHLLQSQSLNIRISIYHVYVD